MQVTKHDAWRDVTVATILNLRMWAIRNGTSPLRAWDTVSERVRLATRRSSSAETWISKVMQALRIGPVDEKSSALLAELAETVGEDSDEWLAMVEDQHQFLFALAREQFDTSRKSSRRSKEQI